MNVSNLTATQLRRAADIQERIEALSSELSSILAGAGASNGQSAPSAAAKKVDGRGRNMSAAGRARIAAAAKARWAKIRADKSGNAPSKASNTSAAPAKGKRTMSPAARAKIAAAARARWAKVRAGK